MDVVERNFLYDACRQRPEFLKLFTQNLADGKEICPKCLNFRTLLYDIPNRLVEYGLYMYARNKQAVCHYCLSDAANQRNIELAEIRREIGKEIDGEIMISERIRGYMSSAGRELDSRTGAVYLAQKGDLTKIGATSRDVHERVRQLGNKTHTLLMALYLDAPFVLESYLHARYIKNRAPGKLHHNSTRVARRTDYFYLTQDDVNFIAGIRSFEGMPVSVRVAPF